MTGNVSTFDQGDNNYGRLESWFRTLDGQCTLTVSDIHQSRGEWSAELKVASDGRRTIRTRLNMTADRTVQGFAQRLDADAHQLANTWRSELPDLLWSVIDHMREGDQAVALGGEDYATADLGWAVRPWWVESGSTVLFGPGGSGKSMIALTLALEAASGQTIISSAVDITGPVLYCDWETGRDAHEMRFRKLRTGANITEHHPVMYRREFLPLHQGLHGIMRTVEDHDIAAVIMDSKGKALGGDLKDAGEVLRLFANVDMMGIPAIVIDHTTHEANRQAAADVRPFGSAFTGYSARLAWSTNAQKFSDHLVITAAQTKDNDTGPLPAQNIRCDFTNDGYEWSLSDRPATTERSPLPDRIEAILRTEGAQPAKYLADVLEASPATIRSALNRHHLRFAAIGSGRLQVWGITATNPPLTPDPY